MSRELLERISKFAQENYPTQMRGLVAEIEVELKKAELAKPVQEPKPEPMLMVNVWSDNGQSYFNVEWKRNPIYWEEGKYSLYTHQPVQQNPLTIDEAETIFLTKSSSDDWLDLVRAIEKAHGIGDL